MSQTMSQSGGSTVSDNQSEQEEQKFPVKFEWKEGGNDVYLTGSFCNWEHQFQMNMNATSHNYELLLYLPKGLYEFKFIVDNKWRYSSFIPRRIDNNGNNNNYIDNTEHPSESSNEEKENKKHKREKIPRNSSKPGLTKEVEYNRMFPKKGELNEEAPNVPMIYLKQLNGLYKMAKNRNANNSMFYDINLMNNSSYQMTQIPLHANLNHVIMRCKDEADFLSFNVNIRVKKKFTSILYYCPIKQCKE